MGFFDFLRKQPNLVQDDIKYKIVDKEVEVDNFQQLIVITLKNGKEFAYVENLNNQFVLKYFCLKSGNRIEIITSDDRKNYTLEHMNYPNEDNRPSLSWPVINFRIHNTFYQIHPSDVESIKDKIETNGKKKVTNRVLVPINEV